MHTTKKRAVGRRLAVLALAGLGLSGVMALARRKPDDLHDKVVIITGSSRGLGLALAEEFARQGARIVLCARDGQRLEAARQHISALGVATLAIACDVTDQYQIEHLRDVALAEFGTIDILVNTASRLIAGPGATSELQGIAGVMDVSFWGTVYATLAVLPHMRACRSGRIVNITSISGKVSIPGLLAFSSAKFAAVGFSEGLRAELAHTGVAVTTVIPGLPATGPHIVVPPPGDGQGNDTLFDLMTSPALTSHDTDKAARQIVAAIRRGDAEVVLPWQAHALTAMHGPLAGRVGDIRDFVARNRSSATFSPPKSETSVKIAANAPTMLEADRHSAYNEGE